MLKGSLLEVVLDLIHSIMTPIGLSVDEEEWGAKRTTFDSSLSFPLQQFLYGGVLDRLNERVSVDTKRLRFQSNGVYRTQIPSLNPMTTKHGLRQLD